MNKWSNEDRYRCDLCHGAVDSDTRERARRAWQPLIICERCVRGTDASLIRSPRGGS